MADEFFNRKLVILANDVGFVPKSELELHQFKDAKSLYDDAVAPRTDKHGGYIAYDNIVKGQTHRCPHCHSHFVVRKGSGKIRHFCPKCMESTCGRFSCLPQFCKTYEQKMNEIEAAEAKRREVESWLK